MLGGGDSILANHKNPPPSTDSTPTNCSWDLSGVIFTEIDSANCLESCTSRNARRTYGVTASGYKDAGYPPQTQPNCGDNSSSVSCVTSFTSTLVYYVYWPKHNYDPGNGGCVLPAMILIHAGSFSDCSNIEPGNNMKLLAREFAKRGFVSYVVEYRRGNFPDQNTFNNIRRISAQQTLAAYRAGQDIRGFIRSIIYRQNNHSSYSEDDYQIDVNKLFIGGASAGANIAITAAFYQDQSNQLDPISPRIASGQDLVSSTDILGPADRVYYDCNTCTTNYYPKILGVMSMWGAGYIPPAYATNIATASSYFTGNDIPSFIGFHGTGDQTAYPYFHPAYFSDYLDQTVDGFSFNWAKESNCLLNSSYTYNQNNPGDAADLYQGGSQMIYEILRHNCIPAELYLDTHMEHGLDNDGTGFNSNFGAGLTNSTLVNTYMVQRSATFFQAVMNGYGNELGDSKFVDCENERVTCTRPYHTECGTNDYDCD